VVSGAYGMSNTEIYLAMLAAWLAYHKNASPDQIGDAKKRITKLLGE